MMYNLLSGQTANLISQNGRQTASQIHSPMIEIDKATANHFVITARVPIYPLHPHLIPGRIIVKL